MAIKTLKHTSKLLQSKVVKSSIAKYNFVKSHLEKCNLEKYNLIKAEVLRSELVKRARELAKLQIIQTKKNEHLKTANIVTYITNFVITEERLKKLSLTSGLSEQAVKLQTVIPTPYDHTFSNIGSLTIKKDSIFNNLELLQAKCSTIFNNVFSGVHQLLKFFGEKDIYAAEEWRRQQLLKKKAKEALYIPWPCWYKHLRRLLERIRRGEEYLVRILGHVLSAFLLLLHALKNYILTELERIRTVIAWIICGAWALGQALVNILGNPQARMCLLYPLILGIGIALLLRLTENVIMKKHKKDPNALLALLEPMFRAISPKHDTLVRNLILRTMKVMADLATISGDAIDVKTILTQDAKTAAMIGKSINFDKESIVALLKSERLDTIRQRRLLIEFIFTTLHTPRGMFRFLGWDLDGSLNDGTINILFATLPVDLIFLKHKSCGAPVVTFLTTVLDALGKNIDSTGILKVLPAAKELKISKIYLSVLKFAHLGYKTVSQQLLQKKPKIRGKAVPNDRPLLEIVEEILEFLHTNTTPIPDGVDFEFGGPADFQ
jgi:hypothetical protein